MTVVRITTSEIIVVTIKWDYVCEKCQGQSKNVIVSNTELLVSAFPGVLIV